MTYLDTHIILYLASGNLQKLSTKARTAIDDANSLLISPMVNLELQYLYELEKINYSANAIISPLEKALGLKICNSDFATIILHAVEQRWTRDPFDRIITATAAFHQAQLITADQKIAAHYAEVVW